MQGRFALALFAAAVTLAACDTAPNPPMAGSAAGAAPETAVSGMASERAGAGCPAVTQGEARLVTRGEGPVVLRTGPGRGTLADPARGGAIAPGGGADSCP